MLRVGAGGLPAPLGVGTCGMGPSKREREAGFGQRLWAHLHLICMGSGGVKLKAGEA